MAREAKGMDVFMAKIKYSAIVGSLGQNCDRFLREGYKYPEEIKNSFEEEVEALAGLGVLDALDLYYAETGINSDADKVNELLDKYDLTVSSVFPNVFGERRWQKGSLTNADPATRRNAIELCRKAIDFSAGLKGNVPVNLWLGQDGFDYPLQVDYKKQFHDLADAIRELADYNPNVRITLEAKVREPRNRTIIDTVSTALLYCREVDRPNVGLAIDIGHIWQAQQNVAQTIALADTMGKLWTLHVNDNYNMWDDDMIAGSVRTTEYIEMFYYLKKYEYDGYLAVDIFPYRDDTLRCTSETILNLKKFEMLTDLIGMDKLGEVIASGDAAKMTKLLRESIYR